MNKIDTKIMNIVKDILGKFGNKYLTKEGSIKRYNIIEDLNSFDTNLMTALLKNKYIYEKYVKNINGVNIFTINKFISMFEFKDFWADSYTKYSNKIGLTSDDKFIDESADVVLSFPFKDSVLKAGMSKDENDESQSEIIEPFLNETIAKPEIDELLEPKIFGNVKKYDKNGQSNPSTFSDTDNLIIKGNNLIALSSIREKYAGKIKLIYLDPPFNTGSNDFPYNDKFNHSTWLSFMKTRLEIARDLLSDDGFIFVHTDDGELHYLKVLMDSVFGRDKYLNTIVVKSKTSSGASGGGEDKRLKKNTEFITVYANDFASIKPQKTSVKLMDYIKQRKLSGKTFAYTKVLIDPGKLSKIGKTLDGQGNNIELFKVSQYKIKTVLQVSEDENISKDEVYKKYFDKIFTTENAQTSIRQRVKDASDESEYIIARYVPISGKNKGKKIDVGFIGKTRRLVSFLKSTAYMDNGTVYKTEKSGTLWEDISWSSIKKEGDIQFENGEKPEKLLERIIKTSTEPEDIVLDFFMGSGTTQAVAMKTNRQFIGVEQMDYINSITVPRLKNVIDGDSSGISKEVDWKGGSSFIYTELIEKNNKLLKEILNCTDELELDNVYEKIKNNIDLDFRVDLAEYEKIRFDFNVQFNYRKKLLVKMLDKNQLYYNFKNIDDENVKSILSDSEYQFNKSFYDQGD